MVIEGILNFLNFYNLLKVAVHEHQHIFLGQGEYFDLFMSPSAMILRANAQVANRCEICPPLLVLIGGSQRRRVWRFSTLHCRHSKVKYKSPLCVCVYMNGGWGGFAHCVNFTHVNSWKFLKFCRVLSTRRQNQMSAQIRRINRSHSRCFSNEPNGLNACAEDSPGLFFLSAARLPFFCVFFCEV